MYDRKWKLGNDLYPEDNILDGLTFEELITTVQCNCRVLGREAVRKQWKAIIEQRLDDARYLLDNNIDEILAAVRKGREA